MGKLRQINQLVHSEGLIRYLVAVVNIYCFYLALRQSLFIYYSQLELQNIKRLTIVSLLNILVTTSVQQTRYWSHSFLSSQSSQHAECFSITAKSGVGMRSSASPSNMLNIMVRIDQKFPVV